jgi:geranylgeranyl diphosphate/geranylgeranyl-bacteriochlorophyllide a reductase
MDYRGFLYLFIVVSTFLVFVGYFENSEVFIYGCCYSIMLISFDELKTGYDVIIVGGGRAGYAVAKNLSDRFKILVIDLRTFPRDKACSGVLIPQSQELLNGDLGQIIFSSPNVIDIEYVDSDNGLNGLIKTKGFLNTDRFEFDKYLFEKIKNKENIDFVQDAKLIEFDFAEKNDYLVAVIESQGVVKSVVSKYLVGCDGASSTVRKKIFKREIKFYVAIQELIPLENKMQKALFILDNSLTDYYCWLIPKGKFIEVGGLFPPEGSRKVFAEFKKKIVRGYGVDGKGDIEAAIVLRPSNLKDVCFGKGNIFLCGEAGAMISPRSAEGISFALESGKKCAESINSNSKEPLLIYKKSCGSLMIRLEKEMNKAKIFSSISKRKSLFK